MKNPNQPVSEEEQERNSGLGEGREEVGEELERGEGKLWLEYKNKK